MRESIVFSTNGAGTGYYMEKTQARPLSHTVYKNGFKTDL